MFDDAVKQAEAEKRAKQYAEDWISRFGYTNPTGGTTPLVVPTGAFKSLVDEMLPKLRPLMTARHRVVTYDGDEYLGVLEREVRSSAFSGDGRRERRQRQAYTDAFPRVIRAIYLAEGGAYGSEFGHLAEDGRFQFKYRLYVNNFSDKDLKKIANVAAHLVINSDRR